MRVLLASYNYPPSIGGVERHSQLLATGLAERGHLVHVIAARAPGSARDEQHGNLSVRRVAAGTGSRWRKMGTYLAEMLVTTMQLRNRVDVIHVQQALYPAAAMAVVSALWSKPLVVTNHGGGPTGAVSLMSSLPLGRVGLRLIRARATCVGVSDEVRRELVKAGFKRVIQIPNGVVLGPDARQESRTAARKALGLDGHVVTYIGRLDMEKNVELLLRAWQQMPPDGRTLLIVGDGPRRDALESLAYSNPYRASTIQFRGFASDVRPFLLAADAFVLPSRSEGMPIALLEAMASGLPVVATDVGGSHEILAGQDVGVLIPSDDVEALSTALVYLEQNPDRANEMGRRARRYIADHFSAERVVSAYEDLYRSVIEGHAKQEHPCLNHRL